MFTFTIVNIVVLANLSQNTRNRCVCIICRGFFGILFSATEAKVQVFLFIIIIIVDSCRYRHYHRHSVRDRQCHFHAYLQEEIISK